MCADRLFFFLICDAEDGAIVCRGRVVNAAAE